MYCKEKARLRPEALFVTTCLALGGFGPRKNLLHTNLGDHLHCILCKPCPLEHIIEHNVNVAPETVQRGSYGSQTTRARISARDRQHLLIG